MKHLEVLKDIV